MSETGIAIDENPVEAVIISGPRKGQIIRLTGGESIEVSPEELQALNDALDVFDAKLDKLAQVMRMTKEALKPRPETS